MTKILVVEDLKIMHRVIANALSALGDVEIVEATDGLDALAKLQREKIDLIITDWLMPNMDGIELVESVKRDEDLQNIKTLMITSVDDKPRVVKALKTGVNDYIAKPFKPEILIEKAKKLLNLK